MMMMAGLHTLVQGQEVYIEEWSFDKCWQLYVGAARWMVTLGGALRGGTEPVVAKGKRERS